MHLHETSNRIRPRQVVHKDGYLHENGFTYLIKRGRKTSVSRDGQRIALGQIVQVLYPPTAHPKKYGRVVEIKLYSNDSISGTNMIAVRLRGSGLVLRFRLEEVQPVMH